MTRTPRTPKKTRRILINNRYITTGAYVLQVMQAIFASILVVAIIVFLVMALRQVRRSRLLARLAHTEKMRFASEDPFNTPATCGELEIMQSGHNPRACNVIHGYRNGVDLRGFDYCYEIGHGPRRMTKSFYVVLVHLTFSFDEAVMLWNSADSGKVPDMLPGPGRVGQWYYRGPQRSAESLAKLYEPVAKGPARVEARGDWLMLALRSRLRARDVISLIDKTVTLTKKLDPAMAKLAQ